MVGTIASAAGSREKVHGRGTDVRAEATFFNWARTPASAARIVCDMKLGRGRCSVVTWRTRRSKAAGSGGCGREREFPEVSESSPWQVGPLDAKDSLPARQPTQAYTKGCSLALQAKPADRRSVELRPTSALFPPPHLTSAVTELFALLLGEHRIDLPASAERDVETSGAEALKCCGSSG
jgi:hypothetical protein